MKRLAVALTLALLATLAVAQPQQEAPQPKIAATINGEVLTAEQLDHLYAKLSPQMKANYERSGGKIQFLDNYIRKRLMIQEALKAGFDKQPEVVFDLQVARDSALFDRYIRDVVAMNIVTEGAIKAYYDANQPKFHRGEMVKARHIIATPAAGNVVNTTADDAKTKEEALEKMTTLAQQLVAGAANFGDLASKYSEDGSAPLGGDLGWVERGKMVEAFETVVFALAKGKTSHVFETQFGYHIALVEDRREAGVRPLDEVRREIREILLQEHADEILGEVNRLTNELRASSKIMVYRENL